MDELFNTYTTQTEADLVVRTFNLYVGGQGRTAFSKQGGPCAYQVFIHTPGEYTLVLKRVA
jgi:hypothetical protein